MKITLLSAASDAYWGMFGLTAPNKLEYCLRHHYQLALKRHFEVKKFMLEREKLMLEELPNCDWLFFMGADTLITDMTKPVETLISADCDFVIGVDVNGINNDVLLIRNCPACHQYLRDVMGAERRFANDQIAMEALFQTSPMRVHRVHQKVFNSMPYWIYPWYNDDKGGTWTEGDFVFHAAGLPIQARDKVLHEVALKVRR